MATSTQKISNTKRNLNVEIAPEISECASPGKIQRQVLAEALTIARSKGQEPLLTARDTKNEHMKYGGTCDGIPDE